MQFIIRTIFVLLYCLGLSFVYGQSKVLPKTSKDTLQQKVDSLKPAVVTATFRPHMKGDTLEYAVGNMAMQSNAVVEDLLRRLPGLQIDVNGNITYNGEKIERLLVDGQDIFGSSPIMVTRNFNGDKIALVQILDRKSDNAVFTGIDDGNRTKTLNLVLKESARNGFFGKAEAGGGLGQYYNANGAAAAFRDKEQITLIGMAANTGVVSASTDGASIDFLYGIADPLGAIAGIGIPTFSAIAAHYADTWNGPVSHIEGNYQYSHFFTQPFSSTRSLQAEADSVYAQNQQNRSINSHDQHWMETKYEWKPDDRSEFRFNVGGNNTQGQNQLSATSESQFNDTLVNRSWRSIKDQLSHQRINEGIAWRMRIGRKEGRVFSISSDLSKLDEATNGYLHALDEFYAPDGVLENGDSINQRKEISSRSLALGGTANYTQPLWKGAVIGMSYRLAIQQGRLLQGTYQQGDGAYKELVDSLSSNLMARTLNEHILLNLQGKTRLFSYTMGNDWLGFTYKQQDLISKSKIHFHYSNFAPRVLLNYTFNQGMNIGFQYNAAIREPTISQLAPIKNNNNPLFITLGNPNLKPGYSQALKLDFHRFGSWLINLNLNLSLLSNSISTKTATDSLGRQVSQPMNVDGGWMGGGNLSISRKILGFDVGFHVFGNYSRSMNYVNASLSENISYTSMGGISLNKFVVDRYSLQMNTSLGYFDQISSINLAAPVRYWTENESVALDVWLIPHFEVGTNASYAWQGKTSAFIGNTSVLLWNSHVGRNFLHNKLVVKVQFNNILNQNAGISRTSSANVNTETSTNILGRFWMLSAIYHFDKHFKHKVN